MPTVEVVPPIPPSATYKFPSGPNFNPRGLFRPVAKTLTFADGPWARALEAQPETSRSATPLQAIKKRIGFIFLSCFS